MQDFRVREIHYPVDNQIESFFGEDVQAIISFLSFPCNEVTNFFEQAEFYAIVAPLPTQMRRLTLAHLDWTFSPDPFQTPLLLDPDETRNALQMELSNYAT